MKSLGANTYRFSIAWTRLIPDGGRDDPINEKGIKFYNDLINECLRLGMTPFAVSLCCLDVSLDWLTFRHCISRSSRKARSMVLARARGSTLTTSWDLPEALYHRYGGFLNKDEIVKDYLNYAKLCFDRFGDRVKWWLTFNEPWCIAALGYGIGRFAP